MPVITTEKIYALISLIEYSEEKEEYLRQLSPHYFDKTPQEKWSTLIDRYKLTAPSLRDELTLFKEERSNTTHNLFNLSLASCIAYFEDFCFLSETNCSKFKLSNDQKKLLEQAVSDAMNTCETGKSMRFESVLQLYRNDGKNWVTQFLATHRYNLLLQLSERFNSKYAVNDAMSIHTLATMMQLANQKKLGIKTEHRIYDAYLSIPWEKKIRHYFERHYVSSFLKYEKDVIEHLSLHLLFEIRDLYDAENQWDNHQELLVPPARAFDFFRFIQGRLGFEHNHQGKPIIELLGNWTDTGAFAMPKKADSLRRIEDLIKEKLIKEQYLIEPNHLSKNNRNIYKKLLKKENCDDLEACIEFNETTQLFNNQGSDDADKIASLMALIRKQRKLLTLYPDLILVHLEKKPELISLIPSLLQTNPLFIEATIKLFNQLLDEHREDLPRAMIDNLISSLSELIQSNLVAFKHLSPTLQTNQHLALQLVQRNPWFISLLDPGLRELNSIATAAITQQPLTLFYLPYKKRMAFEEELRNLTAQVSCFYEEPGIIGILQTIRGYANQAVDLEKLFSKPEADDNDIHLNPQTFIQDQAITELLLKEDLSTYAVSQLARYISPEQFMRILKWRKRNHKSDLPYMRNLSYVKKFIRKMEGQGIPTWSDNDWLIRKVASQLVHERVGHPELIAALASNKTWFLALVSYQQITQGRFKNRYQAWFQLKSTVKIFRQFFATTLLPLGISASSFLVMYLLCIAKNLPFIIPLSFFFPFGSLALFIGSLWFMFQCLLDSDTLSEPCFFIGLIGLFFGLQIGLYISLTWGIVECALSSILLTWAIFSQEQSFSAGKLAFLSLFFLPLGPLPFTSYFVALYLAVTFKAHHPLLLRGIKEVGVLLTRLIATVFFKKMTPSWPDNLSLQCEEKIATLQIDSRQAAQDKSSIMEDLWHKIEKEQHTQNLPDTPKNHSTRTLKSFLNKRYTFFYRGIKRTASFYEIDALSCDTRNDTFELPPSLAADSFNASISINSA